MRVASAWLIAALGVGLPGTVGGQPGSPASPPALDTAAIREHVVHLSRTIGPRSVESPAADRAADYIAETLTRMGHDVLRRAVGDVALPANRVAGYTIRPARQASFSDQNVWIEVFPGNPDAEARGADRGALVLIGHYDTVPGSPGAVDNAVAVAVLLELARALARTRPPRPVIVAWTAAEEVGLAGAHALADVLLERSAPPVGLVVSIDLAGSRGALTLNGLSESIGTDWLEWIAAAANRVEVAVDAPIPHRVMSRMAPELERSDHGVFTRRGVPALHLYSRGDDPIYLPYHTAFDTAEQVDARALSDLAGLISALAYSAEPFPLEGGDAGLLVSGPVGAWVIPEWLVGALAISLAGWAVFTLVAIVRKGRRAPRVRGPGLLLAAPMYAAAWVAVWGMFAGWATIAAHPRPWVHDPARAVALAIALAVALVVVAAILLSPRRLPTGCHRYLFVAVTLPLAIGVLLLAAGVVELAWIPLLPAALWGSAAFARRPRWAAALLLAGLFPALLPVAPGFLREAVFHGFFSPSVPLPAYVALVLLPAASAAAYVASRRDAVLGGRARLVVATCALALLFGAGAGLLSTSAGCPGDLYRSHGLTCELPGVAGR